MRWRQVCTERSSWLCRQTEGPVSCPFPVANINWPKISELFVFVSYVVSKKRILLKICAFGHVLSNEKACFLTFCVFLIFFFQNAGSQLFQIFFWPKGCWNTCLHAFSHAWKRSYTFRLKINFFGWLFSLISRFMCSKIWHFCDCLLRGQNRLWY